MEKIRKEKVNEVIILLSECLFIVGLSLLMGHLKFYLKYFIGV
jgi:hypothetical protein